MLFNYKNYNSLYKIHVQLIINVKLNQNHTVHKPTEVCKERREACQNASR